MEPSDKQKSRLTSLQGEGNQAYLTDKKKLILLQVTCSNDFMYMSGGKQNQTSWQKGRSMARMGTQDSKSFQKVSDGAEPMEAGQDMSRQVGICPCMVWGTEERKQPGPITA